MANEETFNLALEALQDPLSPTKRLNAITALLKTIAEEAKQEQGEPVAWVDSLFAELKHGDEDHQLWLYEKLKSWALNNQEKQLHGRPVAWRWGVPKLKKGKFEWRYSINKTREDAIPLYTKEQL